jgi:hypothetical protein
MKRIRMLWKILFPYSLLQRRIMDGTSHSTPIINKGHLHTCSLVILEFSRDRTSNNTANITCSHTLIIIISANRATPYPNLITTRFFLRLRCFNCYTNKFQTTSNYNINNLKNINIISPSININLYVHNPIFLCTNSKAFFYSYTH